jgi:hypothetical protein
MTIEEGGNERNYWPWNKPLSSDVSHILERADGSDNPGDDSDEDMPALATAYDSDDEDDHEDEDMEGWEESAEEELSKHSYYIRIMVDLHDIRAPLEGLELAYLRVLQADSVHRVHQQPTCPCLRVRCQELQGTWQWPLCAPLP